jgi:hypothetical protein
VVANSLIKDARRAVALVHHKQQENIQVTLPSRDPEMRKKRMQPIHHDD